MQVTQVATTELARMAAPYNPRRISKHDLDALRKSLRFFGTVEPVIVNERSGNIVGGTSGSRRPRLRASRRCRWSTSTSMTPASVN